MRLFEISHRLVLTAAVSALILCGCAPKEDADAANIVKPDTTPEQQRQAIENGNYSAEDKARYLEQIKQREMAESMNPNKGGSDIPAGVKIK